MNRIIREATRTDMPMIMQVMESAKKIMQVSGNLHQWGAGYPSEPTYSKIFGGEWLDDDRPYHVIHRIASIPDSHGIFKSIMDFAFAHESNIRIDTHKDNAIMQHNVVKHGFRYCGIIHLASGDERLAFQKLNAH